MSSDSQWIEDLLYKFLNRADELINQQAASFRDSLERWLAFNWPTLTVPGWEQRLRNFLNDWRLNGIRLEPESAEALFAYLHGQSQQMLFDGAQQPEPTFGLADDPHYAICFAAGTPILTRRGLIAIEQVIDGDEVLAADQFNPDGPLAWKRVAQTYHNAPAELINIHLGELPVVRATLNHPFYVRGKGFVAAQHLRAGDLLRSSDDRWVPVTETFRNGDVEEVYNLCVADHHTYFAGGVLVHNESPGKTDPATAIKVSSPFDDKNDDSLRANVGVVGDRLTVHVQEGPGYTSSTSFFGVLNGTAGPGDRDSAQVVVKWTSDADGNVALPAGVQSNARPQSVDRELAADWIKEENTRDRETGKLIGRAQWETEVPANAKGAQIVLVYTDVLYSPNKTRRPDIPTTNKWGDVPAIIGSWSGTLTNGQWVFKVNQNDLSPPNVDDQGKRVYPTDEQLANYVAAAKAVMKNRTGASIEPRDYSMLGREEDTGFDAVLP